MRERDFKGIWIPKDVWLNPKLSIVEKALLAEIDSLKTCDASNEYFAQFFGVSERTISRAVTHLRELGMLEYSFDGRVRTLRLDKLSSLPRQNDYELNNGISKDIPRDNINNTNNQSSLFEDNNTSNTENKKKERAQWFVNTFNSVCKSLPKCQRITPKRSKSINAILSKYTDEEILEVFNNLESSDFCKGKNDRGWRADIDFILREDKFVSALEGKYNSKRKCNVETISGGPKKQVSAEERERIIKNGKKF